MHDYDLVVGDVTDPQLAQYGQIDPLQPQTILIPHVVNNIGAFGAGVAKTIKQRWPQTEKDYRFWLDFFSKHQRSILGQSFSSLVHCTDKLIIVVVHMFAQEGVRRPQNNQPLNYQHLQSCMNGVPEFGVVLNQPFTIHCPKFGAGLGGGSWEEIEKMIRNTWCAQNIPVTVYSYRRMYEQKNSD